MGVIEAIVAVEISPTWAAFSFFVVLIAFLLVRPQGIFGVAGADSVSRATAAGLVRGAAFAAAAVAFPFVFHAAWIVNIGVLTLMYAALATAWNLFSGYTGYISLGQIAFFGLGAYALGITFEHFGIGSGYNPFFALPLVGRGVALASLPIAWIALRTRHMTFAIVTLTLLFVVQQLAFNLHSLTNGSSGLMLPTPSFGDRELRPAVLPRDARAAARWRSRSAGSSCAASSA